jgi:hypothetical protein
MDEIPFVGTKMFNVINHQLKAIKHIQNNFLGGLNVIMSCDFYQTPPITNHWFFNSFNDSINALTPNFWKNNVNVMN